MYVKINKESDHLQERHLPQKDLFYPLGISIGRALCNINQVKLVSEPTEPGIRILLLLPFLQILLLHQEFLQRSYCSQVNRDRNCSFLLFHELRLPCN